MPSFSSKVELTSAASGSGTALADIEFIKGAFYTVTEYDDLADIPIARISDGQIVWVEDAQSTYQATITPPDFVISYDPTVSWSEFTGFGSGGGGGSGYNTGGNPSGGAGGSGVVILRMPTARYSGTTTGSPTVTTDGTDTILTFTASGSYTN